MMKILSNLLFLSIMPLFFSMAPVEPKTVAAKKTIICLTYDDCLESHLSVVAPQLDSFGLKGTFFINSISGSSVSRDILKWKKVAQNGHELGNHTLFHACPEKFGWPKEIATESYSVKKMIAEIKAANEFLYQIDGSQKSRSYAYPCNNFFIGDTDYGREIQKLGLVRFGRAGGDSNSIVKDFTALDIMKVPSWLVVEGTTADQLIAFAEKARKEGVMGIYQFHGVGSSLFKVSNDDHRTFLKYLKQNEQFFQVATFSSAMETAAVK